MIRDDYFVIVLKYKIHVQFSVLFYSSVFLICSTSKKIESGRNRTRIRTRMPAEPWQSEPQKDNIQTIYVLF